MEERPAEGSIARPNAAPAEQRRRSSVEPSRARDSLRDRLTAHVSSSWPWILLAVAIVILAGVLRFWDLGRQGLWFDEIFSVDASMHGVGAAIQATARDTNPPLFYVLEALAIPVLGRSDAAVRVLPALFGVLSTAVMYVAGGKLFNRATGAWAATLFAVTTVAIKYAQEARMYSQLMFFAALLLMVFALLLEKPTLVRSIVTGVVLACLAYTHVYGYMAAPLLLVSVFSMPRLRMRVGRHTLIACAVAALLFLPWLLVVPAQIEFVRSRVATGGWWMKPPDDLEKNLIDNIRVFSPGQQALPSAVFIGLLLVGAFAFPAAGKRGMQLSDDDRARQGDVSILLAVLAIGPVVAGLLISKYVTPVHTIRNSLVCLPAASLLAAHGGLKLRQPFGYVALLLLLLFGLRSLPDLYADTSKGQWSKAAEKVATDSSAGVLAEAYSTAVSLELYPTFRNRPSSANVLWASDLKARPEPTGVPTDLEPVTPIPAFLSRYRRVYVVSHTEDSKAADYMDGLFGWQLVSTEKLDPPVVRLYVRAPR